MLANEIKEVLKMNANKKEYLEQIREQYAEKTTTKLDELKALDRKVKLPAEVFGYTFGVLGSLVLGVGMCLAMKVIGNLMPLGIVVGVLGIAMVSVNYFIYKGILNKRKKKYSEKVLQLSAELLND